MYSEKSEAAAAGMCHTVDMFSDYILLVKFGPFAFFDQLKKPVRKSARLVVYSLALSFQEWNVLSHVGSSDAFIQ